MTSIELSLFFALLAIGVGVFAEHRSDRGSIDYLVLIIVLVMLAVGFGVSSYFFH